MNLSFECVLVFILQRSGCAGRLQRGRVERHGSTGLNVYDDKDDLIDYLSGSRLRSWCLLGNDALPVENWGHILQEDLWLFGGSPSSSAEISQARS